MAMRSIYCECGHSKASHWNSLKSKHVGCRVSSCQCKADAEGIELLLHLMLAAILAPYFAQTTAFAAELGLTEANDGD